MGPDHVVAAHGPHRLSVTHGVTWLATHGGLASFPGKRRVIPSYKYEGRGLKWRHTPHHTINIHSSFEFSLELRVVLGSLGVEVLRTGAGNGSLLQIVPLEE